MALEFKFVDKARPAAMPGGLFFVQVNGRNLCDYQHWAFHSCGVGSLSNFGSYYYPDPTVRGKFTTDGKGYAGNPVIREQTNYEILENHHEQLFNWLREASPDNWIPKEFLMVLAGNQLSMLKKMLEHPFVKEVDHFLNKSHGPYSLHLFRISLMKDFPKS